MTNIFGKRLEMLMNEKKLSQVQLADVLEVKKQSINSYIKGKSRPELDVLMRFADFFECSVDFLLGREDFRSHSEMKAYNKKIEREFCDALDFLEFDKREYYLDVITQNTCSYHMTEGKSYNTEHFNQTIEIIERIVSITTLIVQADNNTFQSKPIKCSIGSGEVITIDSYSAEYMLILRKRLQMEVDALYKAAKVLGDIGFDILEKRFPQVDAVLNLSQRSAKKLAEELSDKFLETSPDESN